MVKFTVYYYWHGILNSSSKPQTFYIKPNKTIKGRLKGLGFSESDFSNEQILGEDFILEISDIEITEEN